MQDISHVTPTTEVPYFNRDLSWLTFNHRVLQEARDENVPLYERIRFLSIFSSNMDEFFRVRMPEILTLSGLRINGVDNELGVETENLASYVQKRVSEYFIEYGSILDGILPALQKNNVHLYYDETIAEEHKGFVRELFFSHILSFLQPEWLVQGAKPIFLENNALYLLVSLSPHSNLEEIHYAVVNIPSDDMARFILLPASGAMHHILFLDDAIRANLAYIFPGYKVNSCYSIKLTRDAELNLEDELTGDLAAKIEASLTRRDKGLPTRFLFQLSMPEEIRRFLAGYFKLLVAEMIPGGRYHNLKDFASLPNPANGSFNFPAMRPISTSSFDPALSILENTLQKDHLIHLPYHSYNPVLKFFNEAAIHPDVEEIYITMYRVAANSHIANALISAAKNGKSVTVFVELKARFDEANNLVWSKKMKEAGVRIVNSIPNLKVHAKVGLVKMKSNYKWKYFGLLSTGNFNESTSRFYTDQVYFTARPEITKELELLFAYLRNREPAKGYKFLQFKELLVCQFNLVDRFSAMIDREIELAKQGKKGHIIIKLNNLQEKKMIEKLYEASRAGVKVELIVRSICCIIPGIEGWSENIAITRIVDRFLEHSRIFYFHNDGQEEFFLGSADWMNRNIYRRIEVCFPIKEQHLRKQLKKILDFQLADNVKASFLNSSLENVRKTPAPGEAVVNAQKAIYEYVNRES